LPAPETQRVLGELHELYGLGFLGGFDEHGADRVEPKASLCRWCFLTK
jgi:hypothetical protein